MCFIKNSFNVILKNVCFLLFFVYSLQSIGQPLKRLNLGMSQPQPEETLPKSKVPIQPAIRKEKKIIPAVLDQSSPGIYKLTTGWELSEAYKVTASGESIFNPNLNTSDWYNAIVPGTVLTTLVEQGVYPDPYFGINNLAIPDTLCRMDWWYRITFCQPSDQLKEKAWLVFNGINYRAEIWLNSKLLGTISGAFQRGKFDVTGILHSTEENILAVRILPPPNPGIPHEASPSAGGGYNGGEICLDGPTFISSIGWDWMPGIRDRNIGIWQDVFLCFSGPVIISDPQVITDLPLPDTTQVDIIVRAQVINHSHAKQKISLTGKIEDIHFEQLVELSPGESKLVTFSPRQFSQLRLKNPRLWWPNGYGEQNLYTLELSVLSNAQEFDHESVRFGIRELSYELTVDAPSKQGWRVEYNPLKAQKEGKPIFDNLNRREAYPDPPSKVSEYERVWIPKLRDGINPDILDELTNTQMSPFLVFKVNGKRIYCKGGNWGMDDAMKRVSRERLEPYFRLHKDANITMIRNWTGESTEEVFYELADEYGILVWNDFWLTKDFRSTDVFDSRLFLANARDVVRRYRNHPSIAIWCARNEGFPLPVISVGCAQIVHNEDGTRHYIPSSRHLNLSPSGPWRYYHDPADYINNVFGFNTEIGIPSVPRAESMRQMMAKEDVWPISDVWYYHDQYGPRGITTSLETLYGKSETLEDFCKKAQMVNYESHRAMFEDWNSKLWDNVSGVMLWMTHPAWPSIKWQIYSWDYETIGSYFGTKKALEPVHIQMNLYDHKVVAINTSLKSLPEARISIRIFDLKAKLLFEKKLTLNVKENQLTDCYNMEWPEDLPAQYLVALELHDKEGLLISENRYWLANPKIKRNFLKFNALRNVVLTGKTITKNMNGNLETIVEIKNPTKVTALSIKLNLRNVATNERILPAYFSDGYFTLLPGESRKIAVDYSMKIASTEMKITAEGYNVKQQEIGKSFGKR